MPRTYQSHSDRLAEARQSLANQLKHFTPTLPDRLYGVILVDPPWRYGLRDNDVTHRNRCAYPPMTLDQICALDIGAIAAKDCYLFLWVTKDHLLHLGAVLASWGFEFKQLVTWVKTTNDGSKARMGVGHWLRNSTEFLAIAVRGNPKCFSSTTFGRKTSNVLYAPIGRHSEKPQASFDLIESLTPGMTKIELFARSRRDGWDAWGVESDQVFSAQP